MVGAELPCGIGKTLLLVLLASWLSETKLGYKYMLVIPDGVEDEVRLLGTNILYHNQGEYNKPLPNTVFALGFK